MNLSVWALAVQADGKIVVGGRFATVNGTPRQYLARLEANGALDASFTPTVDDEVNGLTVEADGKIWLVGEFTNVNGSSRKGVARLESDGTLEAANPVLPTSKSNGQGIVAQPDGKAVLHGYPIGVSQPTYGYTHRLLPEGTLDQAFTDKIKSSSHSPSFGLLLQADGAMVVCSEYDFPHPGIYSRTVRNGADGARDTAFVTAPVRESIWGGALQADGRILISAYDNSGVVGVPPFTLSRLVNDAAVETVTVEEGSRIEWRRSGTAPEVHHVTFAQSTDHGATWTPLGAGTRIAGGWSLGTTPSAPEAWVRARGQTISGVFSRSSGLVEKISSAGDVTTDTPALLWVNNKPELGSGTVEAVTVLLENARPGSLKLAFTKLTGPAPTSAPPLAEADVVLTLDDSLGTIGEHTVTFDSTNPLASAQVIGGAPLPEARYAVAFWYQDAVGNPVVASAVRTLTLDRTPPQITLPANITEEATNPSGAIIHYTASAADNVDSNPLVTIDPVDGCWFAVGTHTVTVKAKDATGNEATGTFTVTVTDETSPVITKGLQNYPLVTDGSGRAVMPKLVVWGTRDVPPVADDSIFHAVDIVGVTSYEQSPAVDTLLRAGTYPLKIKVSDAAGNSASVEATVTVTISPEGLDPALNAPVVAQAGTGALGEPAPGAGLVLGLPEGTTLGTFFAPAIGDAKELAARVTLLDGKKKLAAIYYQDGAGEASLPAFQGQKAPDHSGDPHEATFKSFLDPVVAPAGSLAFAAKLQGGGVKSTTDDGVWTNAFGQELVEALREGGQVPGMDAGVLLKSVTSLSLRDGELVALVNLVSGKGGVKSTDDTVLLRQSAVNSAEVLLREGMPLFGDTVKTISVLSPASVSPGHGRWHRQDTVAAKVTLKKGPTVLVQLAPGAAPELLLATLDADLADANAGVWSKLSLPALGGDAVAPALVVQGTLKTLPGSITTKNDTALLYRADGEDFQIIAQEGDEIDGAGTPRWATFFDPVINAQGQVAFLGTLSGAGVKASDKTVLVAGLPGDLGVVARLGTSAPQADGAPAETNPARFTKFVSYALPDGESSRVFFLAEVAGSGVSAKNKLGLWAQGADGLVRELLRTGLSLELDPEDTRKITAIKLLEAVPGVFGATRSFNATGTAAVLVTFDDKSQALLRVGLP